MGTIMKTVFTFAFARITSAISLINRLGSVVALILAAALLAASASQAATIYVANSGNNTITKFTDGVGSVFASTGLSNPQALALDSAGNLYVANWANNTIAKFTPGGVGSVFATGAPSATGLAFDNAGNLYTTAARGIIYKFTPGGVGSSFVSGLNQPTLLAFDTAGNLYAGSYGNSRIDKFTPGGAGSIFANTGLNAPTGIAVLAVNPVLPCAVAPSGLVGWWKGEGNALASGGDNNGTLAGNTTYGDARVDQGFVFDGDHDGIQLANQANLQLQDFTIEAWIQRSSVSIASHNIGGGLIFSFGRGGYGLDVDNDGHVYVVKNDGSGAEQVRSSFQITDTNWHHLAATKTGTNVVFYLEGVAYPAPPYVVTFTFSTPPAIGARGDGLGNSFLGRIDEVAVYNHALLASEIQAIYNAGSAGKCVSQGPGAFLLNMDFQGNNLTASSKTGFAALGFAATDYWNYYMREDGQGGWRTFGAVTNLRLADGTITEIGMTVANAPGAWCAGSSDAMYDCYIYPFSGNATITVTNLPAGVYDVLPYAVDGNYEVTVGGVSYGIKSSLDDPLSNPPVWTEGVQYARFTNVQVSAGQSLALTVRPGVSGYAVISGMQIVASTSTNNPPPTCVPAPDNLVSWWRGEGNTLDSADGNNGTLAGNTTLGTGRVGQGFVFDGSADLVTVGNPINLQLQNFTIEAWIKRASASVVTYGSYGNGVIFGYGYAGYDLYLDSSGRPALSKVGINETKPAVSITDTNFHHLAVTKSGSAVIFYVDGVPYSAPAYDPGFVFSTVATIGARGDNLDNSFLGTIDETAVYNRPLSAAEIQTVYAAGSAGKCTILPPVNHPPVADATATKSLLIVPAGCQPVVVLDGSRSSDPDGDSLQHLWFKAGEAAAFATGVVAVVTLPLGAHPLTLVVDDGLATTTNAVTVTVITARQAVQRLVVQVNESNIERPRPLLAMLSAAADSLRRHQPRIAIIQLRAFQRLVQAGVSRHDPVLVATLVEAAQEVIEALSQDCALAKPHWKIGKMHRHGHGPMRMEFSAPEGQRCLIEASTNLVDWVAIGAANECGPGEFEFEDSDAARLPARFYRIVAE
jgi:hypothetical protein